MDSPAVAAPATPARFRAWSWALLLAALLGYAAFLSFHVGAYAGQSDSSGYLNSARLLAHGETQTPQRHPPVQNIDSFDWYSFVPLGFKVAPDQRMAPSYPIGLPLALLAVAFFTGWSLAPHIVMVAAALAAVLLMIPLGRAAGLPPRWSIFGALLLAASPLTTFMSLQLMSDVPATAAVTAAILCAWNSRGHLRWALCAGFVFSVAVLIRPNNLIFIAPVALCLGLNPRRWLLFIAGGLPGAMGQLAYSAAAYGHPLASGYGDDLVSKFSLGFVPETLAHYARWLPILLTPVGLGVLVLPWFGRHHRFTWVLIAWLGLSLAFYAVYFHTHETWWYLRFLLPAFPAALVGGLWVVHHLWSRVAGPRLRTPFASNSLALVATVVVLGQSGVWHQRLNAILIGEGESVYPAACTWARAQLPKETIVVALQTSGAFHYYTSFDLVRWDLLNPTRFALIAAAAIATGRPITAVLFPHETIDELQTRAPGQWTLVGSVRHVSFWQWAPPRAQ